MGRCGRGIQGHGVSFVMQIALFEGNGLIADRHRNRHALPRPHGWCMQAIGVDAIQCLICELGEDSIGRQTVWSEQHGFGVNGSALFPERSCSGCGFEAWWQSLRVQPVAFEAARTASRRSLPFDQIIHYACYVPTKVMPCRRKPALCHSLPEFTQTG